MLSKEKLSKIKLIVTDLDGTLINNAGIIPVRTKGLIKKLKGKGITFSFASGRLHSALTDFAGELSIKAPIISLDGSLIRKYPGNEILFEYFVPKKQVIKALNFCDKFLLSVALCHPDAVYYTEKNSKVPQLMDKFGVKYIEVDSYDNYLDNVLEIAIVSELKNNIKFVYDKMGFPYSLGLRSSFYSSFTNEGVYYLEIRRKGANKGKALIKLCNSLKVELSETAVIGDWHNDISLFHPKALKVTLSNGIPELKEIADIVINKDNDEEGAADFLEMLNKVKTR